MKNKELEKNKFKLTIFFSILVFLLAIFLELIFFSFKYFNEKNIDKKRFLKETNNIEKRIEKQKDILALFSESLFEEEFWEFNKKRFEKLNKKLWKKISFFILDENNEVISKKIVENVDFEIFSEINNKIFYSKHSTFILTKKLNNHILWNKIIFYKKYNYDIYNLLKDFSLFILITFLSTIIFYILGKKFVWKNLKPVEENLADMESFIQNSSHELKTRLSIIHSNLGLIKSISKEKETLKLTREAILELENFDSLINWLTELSGINLDLKKENLNLKEEIEKILQEYKKQIFDKKIKINFIKKSDLKIFVNSEHFQIFFSNLLSNAIKYNKNSWEINIILEKNKLIISDSWIWIKKENLNKIFDRFYRENNSKTSQWFGIWLSLVQKIALVNNWKINIKSELWVWTSFEILF